LKVLIKPARQTNGAGPDHALVSLAIAFEDDMSSLSLHVLYSASESGSGRPCVRQYAVNVFASRHAIVIGPTPPGTGVIAPATAATSA
jgi:hypothetical protein